MKSVRGSGMIPVFLFLSAALLSMGISGGPNYGGNKPKRISVVGTYAGSLFPTVPTNSLGLFTVQIPATGLGAGTISLFLTGNAYTGTIQATADPDTKQVTGFINAGFNYIKRVESSADADGNTTITSITVRAVATGGLNAVVKKGKTASQTVRLNGTALLTFDLASADDFGLPPSLTYTVIGFKQSGT